MRSQHDSSVCFNFYQDWILESAIRLRTLGGSYRRRAHSRDQLPIRSQCQPNYQAGDCQSHRYIASESVANEPRFNLDARASTVGSTHSNFSSATKASSFLIWSDVRPHFAQNHSSVSPFHRMSVCFIVVSYDGRRHRGFSRT